MVESTIGQPAADSQLNPGDDHANRHYSWFAFYPREHASNLKLKMASPPAKGIWMDFICVAYDAPEPGRLAATPEQFVRLLGCSRKMFERFLKEAKEYGFADVRDLDDGRVEITCRRMVRDVTARRKEADKKDRQRNRNEKTSELSELTAIRSREDQRQPTIQKSATTSAPLASMSPSMSPVDNNRSDQRREDQIKSENKKEDSENSLDNRLTTTNGNHDRNGTGSDSEQPPLTVVRTNGNSERSSLRPMIPVTGELLNPVEKRSVEELVSNGMDKADAIRQVYRARRR